MIILMIIALLFVIYIIIRRPQPTSEAGRIQFSNRLMAHRGGAAGALRSRCKGLPPSDTPTGLTISFDSYL
jgi:hypothetical protein